MTNTEKIWLLSQEPPQPCCLVDYYQGLLERMGDLICNYGDYLVTEPINCDEELKRVSTADYELCCALFTMLFREDHFDNGSFDHRVERGDVKLIVERMRDLIREELQ